MGRHCIVDATSDGESHIISAVWTTIDRKGHVFVLARRGGAGLGPSIILDMMSIAKHTIKQLIKKLESDKAAVEVGEKES